MNLGFKQWSPYNADLRINFIPCWYPVVFIPSWRDNFNKGIKQWSPYNADLRINFIPFWYPLVFIPWRDNFNKGIKHWSPYIMPTYALILFLSDIPWCSCPGGTTLIKGSSSDLLIMPTYELILFLADIPWCSCPGGTTFIKGKIWPKTIFVNTYKLSKTLIFYQNKPSCC